MSKAFNRGFTLIELMIVIVILGVLMGTILPRLTGAQARARDTGRIADLNTIAQALETYYDDNNEYPPLPTGTAYDCLDSASTVGSKIKDYLKGGEIPKAPNDTQETILTSALTCTGGKYLYIPLASKGVPDNGYALASDVELWQTANLATNATAPSGSSWTTYTTSSYQGFIEASKDTETTTPIETADATATQTVYMIVK